MSKVELKVKEVDSFFEELLIRCRHKEAYSVVEIAKEMGVSYLEVENWVQSNNEWAYVLRVCQEMCCIHVEQAELLGYLSEQDAVKYLNDNNRPVAKL